MRSMKKMSAKLFAAVMTLIIAIVIAVSVTYAWMTLSTSPSVGGATIKIGGGTNILLAPDVTKTVDGVTVHYPGAFTDTLTFDSEAYAYLSDLAGLTPVSTADGVNWFFPKYDAATGEIKDFALFDVDDTLSKANVTGNRSGGYVYIDFWAVAPGSDYKLRVSTDTKATRGSADREFYDGSSLLEIPSVVSNGEGGWKLGETKGNIDTVARVGFLVNFGGAAKESVTGYKASADYDARFKKLVGRYQEPGDAAAVNADNKFTIYEPNGTRHTDGEQGCYRVTNPIGYDGSGYISTIDVTDRLTVQDSSEWKRGAGEGRMIDEVFSGVTVGMTESEARERLNNYVKSGSINNIKTGVFFLNTKTLVANAGDDGYLSETEIGTLLTTGGATDDVYITELVKNTPQRIRMFIWLEGQDADCVASGAGATYFALNLELAGAN